MRMIRRHMIFRGRVQGTGLRYRAEHAACLYGCTGWIRNEWDGSVTMEIQGEEKAIEEVVRCMAAGSYVRIESVERSAMPVVEEERGFRSE